MLKVLIAEDDLLIADAAEWALIKGGFEVCGIARTVEEAVELGRLHKPDLAVIDMRLAERNDLREDNDFELPPFYAAHGIISTIDVLIRGAGHQPYGVLEVDSDTQHNYGQHDIEFLTGFANVLAEAVSTSSRTVVLETTVGKMQVLVEEKDRLLNDMQGLVEEKDRLLDEMKVLVEEKDRLLEQKKILADELQHRVRNNLQLVYGMLSKQLDDTADPVGQRGIRAIARRVTTLAQVYDHLHGTEMTRTTDFGGFVQSLCLDLAEIQARDGNITLTCDSDSLILDLDTVTALGLIVTELVTNSYDHAFPGGKGATRVSVRRASDDHLDMATMTISDDGPGFKNGGETKRHGLGLVRRLIEQVRGTLEVNSEHGTMWTIRFPTALPGRRHRGARGDT